MLQFFRDRPVSTVVFILYSILCALLIRAGIGYKEWVVLPENHGHTVGNEGGMMAFTVMVPLTVFSILIVVLCGAFNKRPKGGPFYLALSALMIAELLVVYYVSF